MYVTTSSQSTNRIAQIEFKCDHNVTYHKQLSQKSFIEGKIQQTGTTLGHEVLPPSRKGKSRSAYNVPANIKNLPKNTDGTVTSLINGRKPGQVNKTFTICAKAKDERCHIQFTLFCDKDSGNWYLSRPKSLNKMSEDKSSCFRYHNHFRILPEHLPADTKHLSDDVTQFITNHIQCGATTQQIQSLVQSQYNTTISLEQIKTKKHSYVDGMVGVLDSNNSTDSTKLSAAEKLIKIFEKMDDVSFVYVKHHIDSGFVTYTKDKGNIIHKTSIPHKDSENLAAEIEIDTWRTTLGLSNNKEILVAFAWSHDYELRKLRMYPEWMAIDGTFGVNKQKRSLLTATGYDGERKSFVGFRCFMPSKQKRAYSWAIGKALPFLVGEAIEFNQVITCDMEDALCNAIREHINDPSSPLHKSKIRIDFYHIFEQKWSEHIRASVYRINGQKEVLDKIHNWISSWFDKIETTSQYQHSLSTFNQFIEHNKDVIGDHYLREIEKIVGNIKRFIKDCGSHHFMNRSTLGSKSSSVAEGSNFTLKSGPHAVKASMNIATSAHAQTQQVRRKEQERNVELSTRLIKHSSFSQSKTKDLVTDYMDLLLCKMHDTSEMIRSFYFGNGIWYCISSKVLESFSNQAHSLKAVSTYPTYVNIRQVTLKDSFMTCTCGKVHAFMSPCIHIVAVLKSQTNVIPAMIPIRWWYTFMYYHRSDASFMAPNVNTACIDMLANFRLRWFNKDGSFKGIYISLNDFDICKCQQPDNLNSEWRALHCIQKFIEVNGYLVKYGAEFNKLKSTRSVTKRNDFIQSTNIRFGGDAISMSQLSQTYDNGDESEYSVDKSDKDDTNMEISLQDTIDLITDTFYACPNDVIRADLYRTLIEFKFKNCSHQSDGSMLGSEHSNVHGKEPRKRRRGDSSKSF